MNFFRSLFGDQVDAKADFWQEITDEDAIQHIRDLSFSQKVVIFKHSTHCFISKRVLKNFEQQVNSVQPKKKFFFLDLLKFRKISDRIAKDFGVVHESPQLIVLEKGTVIHHASHQNIDLKTIP